MVIHVISGLLKTQHFEIIKDLHSLEIHLEKPFSLEVLGNIRAILRGLDHRVVLHLAQEDNILYPRLLECSHDGIRRLASGFMADLGGLSAEFPKFVQRWQSEDAMVERWPEFVAESFRVIALIHRRIEMEEQQLFPLIDQLE